MINGPLLHALAPRITAIPGGTTTVTPSHPRRHADDAEVPGDTPEDTPDNHRTPEARR